MALDTNGNPISPDTMVPLKGNGGVITMVPSSKAQAMVSDPNQNYYFPTEKDVNDWNIQQTYNTTGQKILTGVEGAADYGTGGLIPAAINGVMDQVNPQWSAQNQANSKARKNENPIISAGAGAAGIAYDPWELLGGAKMVGDTVAYPFMSEYAPSAVNKILGSTVSHAVQGGLYQLTRESAPVLLENRPYSSDAMTNILNTSFMFGTFGAAMETAKVAHEGISSIKAKAGEYFKKTVNSVPDMNVPDIKTETIDPQVLPKNPTDLGKPATTFEVVPSQDPNAVPVLKHTAGDSVTKINADQLTGKGADFNTPSGLIDVGRGVGIDDLDVKYPVLKTLGDNVGAYLSSEKTNQIHHDFVFGNEPVLNTNQRQMLDQHNENIANLKNNPNDPIFKQNLIDSTQQINNVSNQLSNSDLVSNDQKNALTKSLSIIPSQIKAYVGGLDFAKEGNQVHLFNNQSIQGNVIRATGEVPYNETSKQVVSDLNLNKDSVDSVTNSKFNEVAHYMKNELYPKSLDDLPPGKHLIDYATEKNESNLEKYRVDLNDAVNLAANTADSMGIVSRITRDDIAKYIEKKILPTYSEPDSKNPNLMVPKPGFEEDYNAIKAYANQFRANGNFTNKFGNVEYHKIPVGELRNMRLDVDALGWPKNGTPPVRTSVQMGARQLRGFLEEHVINTIEATHPELMKQYLAAKYNSHMALQADTILGLSQVKAFDKAMAGNKNVIMSMMGAQMGRLMGHATGIPGAGMLGGYIGAKLGSGIGVGGSAGRAMGVFNSYSDATRAYMEKALGDVVKKYEGHLDRAALGIISKSNENNKQTNAGIGKTYSDVKKDINELQQSKQAQEGYYNDLFDKNKALINFAPNTFKNMISTQVKANAFLLSKAPVNPYEGMPWRAEKWEPSQSDIDKFYRYKDAVSSPVAILNQLKTGQITPEAIDTLSNIYPSTKLELQNQILSKMKNEIPMQNRVMLFKVFGIPMDSFAHGQLFAQMQSSANGSAIENLQQNQQKKPINTSKVDDPMKSLSGGSQTIREDS